jgi:phage gpG-like protein
MFKFSTKTNFGVKLFNPDWWEPTKLEWAPVLLNENKPFWKNQTQPNGRPWKPLTNQYRAWKKKKYGEQPILRATGKMQDTAKVLTSLKNDRFEVLTTSFGPYHQFGTKKMAARPWMGVPDQSLEKLSGIAWKHILK